MKVIENAHRPWPVPSKPWLMKQTWHDLLFAHWEIDVEKLRTFVPDVLDIDKYEGKAWIGVIPFHMSNIRLRYSPELPFISKFPEINVRTYVTYKGEKPGVYFLSLDATNLLAVMTAKTFFHLPYYHANIQVQKDNEMIRYSSKRKDSPSHSFLFNALYAPESNKFKAKNNSLEYWLMERYCLYTTHNNSLYRGEIYHKPWEIQEATAEIVQNTMIPIGGFSDNTIKPILHYSQGVEVILWGLEKINR